MNLFPDIPDEVQYGAKLSGCRRYRYRLYRIWDEDKLPLGFIMLNPSTADENYDDPTIRRCMGFARQLGFGGIIVGNLWPLRATDPRELYKNPVRGEPLLLNDIELVSIADECSLVVCAWGAHGGFMSRDSIALASLPAEKLRCFGVTKDGQPKHPLYLPADAELVAFPEQEG